MATTVTGRATDFITFSRTSNATLVASDGKIKWAGHNLVLNSASPATQTVTVISGAQYTVEMTGSGSIALSGAGSGTVSSGSPVTVTASSTSLTLTISGTVSTMWAYRSDLGGMVANPATSTTYYPTTSAAYYAPRLDFDPVTLAARGLLVEEQRTNIVLRSQEFDNGTWAIPAGVVNVTANSVTAPDGTLTADKLVPAAATDYMLKRQYVSPSATSHTFSIYAKHSDTGYYLELFTSIGGNAGAVFNLSTGAVLGSANCTTVVSSPDANGWRRYSITFTATASTTYVDVRVTTASTINQSMTGDGTSGIVVWGAQLEAGSFATSYIPTGASTATRTADVASVSTQAFPYSASEGTVVVSAVTFDGSGSVSPRLVALSDGTSNNVIRTLLAQGRQLTVVNAGSTVADLDAGNPVANAVSKVGAAFNANDFVVVLNAGAAATGSSGSIPSVNKMDIGQQNGTGILSGHIRQITYLPRRLTNAELQSRTA